MPVHRSSLLALLLITGPAAAAPASGAAKARQVARRFRRWCEHRERRKVPGSVAQLNREDLRQLAPQNVADALRTVSVCIVGEDSMGLRVNLGIRGLDPNRSRKVLILEDGVPTAPNPHGVPGDGLHPSRHERIESIDVVKGSGRSCGDR